MAKDLQAMNQENTVALWAERISACQLYPEFRIPPASNVSVATNTKSHAVPLVRYCMGFSLVEVPPQSPANTEVFSNTQDRSCGYAIENHCNKVMLYFVEHFVVIFC